MPKSPDPSSTFPCVQMLSRFLIVRLCHSYVTCQVQYVSFSFCIFFFPLLMLFSRLSLTGLPSTPSTMLPQPPPPPPQHLPAPQHSSCNFLFFFLVVLHLLTLISKHYLQLLHHPIPLCRIPTLCWHHLLHALSTPLLASSSCIDALVTVTSITARLVGTQQDENVLR